MASVDPSTGRTLSGQIHHELRQDILAGRIEAGTRLVVDALAKRFATSITPIREALRLLQRDGLIEMVPHRGATVCLPDKDSFADLYDVRSALEPMATERACPQLDAADLDALAATIAVGQRCLDGAAEAMDWIAADGDFHALIWERSGNPLLARMLGQLTDSIQLHRQLYFVEPARIERSMQEHRAILDGLRAGDARAAGEAMRDHMRFYLEDAGS